ncbi:MAG: tagaturonate reductase [Ruminococcaceae bacterium]|nr:tagaturonate reductase [Oscillospiraceae bacterium]
MQEVLDKSYLFFYNIYVSTSKNNRRSHMKAINFKTYPKTDHPIRILQFGQGNFLRAFADDFIDQLNLKELFDGSVLAVKTTTRGTLDDFKDQNCLYTLCTRGIKNGEILNASRIVECIHGVFSTNDEPEKLARAAVIPTLQIVISNTTEAGITLEENDCYEPMPLSFPAKLCKLLYLRFCSYGGASDKGLYIIPTELIESNGDKLKECIITQARLWRMGEGFEAWINSCCHFYNTLVDRIVSGYPKNNEVFRALGYTDPLCDVCEPFGLWVLQGDESLKDVLPLHKAEPPAVFCDDITPYRDRKVRILNGAHTSFSPLGVIMGLETVKDCIDHPDLKLFLEKLLETEIKPYVKLPKDQVDGFTASVIERFSNPYLDHAIIGICLNSVSKFKARLLDSFKDYYNDKKAVPKLICFSFAALLRFYSVNEENVGTTDKNKTYTAKDNEDVLRKMRQYSSLPTEEYVKKAASEKDFWGMDLSSYPDFVSKVACHLEAIKKNAAKALKEVLK